MSATWWHKPQRVIQPNLQVRDTGRIVPRELAAQLKEMGATAIVFNVGGIYAWYRSDVPYHTVNEFLPSDRDLLEEVIEACHAEGLRFIARLDFSKAEDSIFLRRPQWFVRDLAGEPEIIGAKRPGQWSLLMSTCINGPYRNEAVAVPVLKEVLDRYPVDGIFFNAPHYVPCWCERCQAKYEARYGVPLPPERGEMADDWPSVCIRENMRLLYAQIKEKRAEVPAILYYNLYRDNLYDRIQTADLLCTEPQDVLSLGQHHIPEFWKPALSIKLGRSLPDRPAPFGIVHSSPGMDWRHTGLPPAEYRFWLSQIPAHGGSIWHSLTGIPDTIGDKRILDTVTALNRDAAATAEAMDGARTLAQVALLWTADATAEGWADGLINNQIPFDVLLAEQATAERLDRYRAVIVPGGMNWREEWIAVLAEYVKAGGHAILEGRIPNHPALLQLIGVADTITASEPLAASYLRFEGEVNPLREGFERTELIAHKGTVFYTEPNASDVEVLATLVPPFSPPESVGAPPERASLPVSHTDLPLALRRKQGSGSVLYLPFELSYLINDYKLGEHYKLLANTVHAALGEENLLEIDSYPGLQTTLFENGEKVLLHLVNGAGKRPLVKTMPLHDINVKLRLPGKTVERVSRLIGEEELNFAYREEQGQVSFTVPRLDIWECIQIE